MALEYKTQQPPLMSQVEAGIDHRNYSQLTIGKKVVTTCHILMKNGVIFSGVNYGPEDKELHSHEVAYSKSYEQALQKAVEAFIFFNAQQKYIDTLTPVAHSGPTMD